MYTSCTESEFAQKGSGDVLVAIAALITESRTPLLLRSPSSVKSVGIFDGPHCIGSKNSRQHVCDPFDKLCIEYESVREQVANITEKGVPVCIDLSLTCACDGGDLKAHMFGFLLEKWTLHISRRRCIDAKPFTITQLICAIRSQLYFSQLTAWLSPNADSCSSNSAAVMKPPNLTRGNVHYSVAEPDGMFNASMQFTLSVNQHDFPYADLGNGLVMNVSYQSLPRLQTVPELMCNKCSTSSSSSTPATGTTTPPTTPTTTTATSTMTTLACSSAVANTCAAASSSSSRGTPTKQAALSTKKKKLFVVDDRLQTSCTLMGKHRCEDYDDLEFVHQARGCDDVNKKLCYSKDDEPHQNNSVCGGESCSSSSSCPPSTDKHQNTCSSHRNRTNGMCEEEFVCSHIHTRDLNTMLLDDDDDSLLSDSEDNTIFVVDVDNSGGRASNTAFQRSSSSVEVNRWCNTRKCLQKVCRNCRNHVPVIPLENHDKSSSSSSTNVAVKLNAAKRRPIRRLTFDESNCKTEQSQRRRRQRHSSGGDCVTPRFDRDSEIPSSFEQAKFRKNLDYAANMVFHARTGLPLTSSPAPIRRGRSCFDFDSSINSVSAIKSALFPTTNSTDDEYETESAVLSPCSPDTSAFFKLNFPRGRFRYKNHSGNLLGNFEESVLNGRLEPVSTVHGFVAELGASGSFVPNHIILPVTVFFYTLGDSGDSDKQASPYLGHINLGKKGYNVPKTGAVQVTLFNPLGTVVKMFVVMYDLSDMPSNSQTFIRQRTLFMPSDCTDDKEWGSKWLRFLIHLRFLSSKSGKIYLHSDIRMIIFRKSDMDTATVHGPDVCHELRSFTHKPTNPRFSPRK